MAFVGKTYNYEKEENFSDFLKALGVTSEHFDYLINYKPAQKLDKNGDDYTLVIGNKEIKFQNGVEFDYEIIEGLVAKTTFTIAGNVLTQVEKFKDGRIVTYKREYSDSGLVVTMTTSNWDGSARRYYVAA